MLMSLRAFHILTLIGFLLLPAVALAQQPRHRAPSSRQLTDTSTRANLPAAPPRNASLNDSIAMLETLGPIEISVQRGPSEVHALSPTQVVTAEKMEQTGALQLSDAVRQLAGVTLKDYGGIGGLKTVSARGLGSQFSTLSIDGIAVSDAQNGQIDLGRYLLGNSAYISFTNGQAEELLQTARIFAAGNVLNMETQQPSFLPHERTRIRIGMEGGSFGYISPALYWEQKTGKKTALTLWTNWLKSDGDYPFRLYYTHSRQDSSSIERRNNSQTRMGTIDANLFHRASDRSQLTGKLHFMKGYHALPGPVRYYRQDTGSEHSEEKMFFAQTKWSHDFGRGERHIDNGQKVDYRPWSLLLLGKFQHSLDVYEDTAYINTAHFLHNDYTQNEGYLSSAIQYSFPHHLKLSLCNDMALNTMVSNLVKNNDVQRLSDLSVLAASYKGKGISASANILHTWMHEKAWSSDKSGNNAAHEQERDIYYNKYSPFLGIALQPYTMVRGYDSAGTFIGKLLRPLRLRYFIKHTYRVPTFGEVYYVLMTRNLQPEEARQHNLGLSYSTELPGCQLSLTMDAYVNRVTNKIVAMPMQNMYLWSMVNFGTVDIHGVDAKAELFVPWQVVQTTLSVIYAYQQALNHSEGAGKSYNNQIPYTPRHSGGISLWLASKWVDVGYDVTLVGDRYMLAQNVESNLVEGYIDQSLSFSHKFLLPRCTLNVRGRIQNLFDVQYEVVKNYPMMGRNFRIALTVQF